MLNAQTIERIAGLIGKRTVDFQPANRGYTPALRGKLILDDATTAFLKMGTTPLTVGWLHDEIGIYRLLHDRCDFMPRLIAFDDDSESPLLLIEDLTDAHWPPIWKAGQVEQVLETLARVCQTAKLLTGNEIPVADESLSYNRSWKIVAENPKPFLSLNLCTTEWLEKALPILLEYETQAKMAGTDLVHLDVRSDNLCFFGKNGERVVLVDWNHTHIANGTIDVAFWLPSLHSESGVLPETILPNAPEWAAAISGFFAASAGKPDIPDAPHVRTVQKSQLRSALPWAIRMLELPPPVQ